LIHDVPIKTGGFPVLYEYPKGISRVSAGLQWMAEIWQKSMCREPGEHHHEVGRESHDT